MRIIVPHNQGREEAKRRIDEAVDRLLGTAFQGIKITDPKKHWEDSTLQLSLRVGAGFVNVLVAATAEAGDTEVVIDCELPPIAKQFVGEEKIRAGIEEKVRGVLEG